MENNVEVSRKHISQTYLFGLFNPLALVRFLEDKLNSYNRIRMIKKKIINKKEYLRMMDKIIRIKVNAFW